MLHYNNSPEVRAVFFGAFAGSAKEKIAFSTFFRG
jgi:hypothetical protein